jgi:hypothetical protein
MKWEKQQNMSNQHSIHSMLGIINGDEDCVMTCYLTMPQWIATDVFMMHSAAPYRLLGA